MEICRINLVNKKPRGLTIIELMIAMAIMGLLIFLAAPSFTTLRKSVALGNAAKELQSALRLVQNRAVAAQGGTGHGVHWEADHYVLFGGSWGAPTYTTTITLPRGINIDGAVVGQTIMFTRLTGRPSVTQEVKLKAGTETQIVRVEGSGLISLP